MKTILDYMNDFDIKYKDLEKINKNWYKKELGVVSYCSEKPTRLKNGSLSEEYIRARFVYSLIHSGKYNKEYICVEFSFPKGNGGKSLDPDIVIFKTKNWVELYEKAKLSENYSEIRKNLLLIMETKKNNDTVEKTIEKQLRPAMSENTSKDIVFGIYFDNLQDILIFKKIGNSELRRYNDLYSLSQDGINDLNLMKRDLFSEIPSQEDLNSKNNKISDVKNLRLDDLEPIDESNFSELMNILKRANDSIRPETTPRELIVEFLTLKVYDEKRSKRNNETLKFYIENDEISQNILEFRKRITKLYEMAQKEYKEVLGSKRLFYYDQDYRPKNINDEKFFIEIVKIFQKRAILKTKNESFNQIIFNNFGSEQQKADKGQFFTPIPIVKTIIKILNPIKGEEIVDPCCGICDFLAMAFKYSHRKDELYPEVSSNYYGFDLESNNLKLAELNLVLNGDGGAILRNINSLTQKMLKDGNISENESFNNENYYMNWKHKIDQNKDVKKFKIIATNPPFGKGRDLKTGKNGKWDIKKNIISLYETYSNKSFDKKKLPNSMDMGVLFLENAYKILENGGRMGIVLSNSIASIDEWKNIRKWFINKMRIVAIIDLPSNTFGETGVATTIIIAYKPKENENYLLEKDYEIFVKDIENIGYVVKTQNRTINFNPIYKIDEETFEKQSELDEDFTKTYEDWKEFLNRQEEEIKEAFHLKEID